MPDEDRCAYFKVYKYQRISLLLTFDFCLENFSRLRKKACRSHLCFYSCLWTWNNDLAAFAQKTVDSLSCSMQHTSSDARKNIAGWVGTYVGENLAYGMNSVWSASNVGEMLTQGAAGWYHEKADYIESSNSCNPGKACGHYTQMVWQTSDKIGCGIALCSSGKEYVLSCVYGPGGNISGRKPYGEEEEAGCVPSTSTKKEGDNTVETTISCDNGCTITRVKTIQPSGAWSSSSSWACPGK